MIITHTTENKPVLSNTGEVGAFTIRSSPKAFSILSSGLYKNKIRAIIRELSCNAVDSHRAAGNREQPFEIHVPSTLEPWFSVKDYGVGLSDAEVKDIYTVYFNSTKTDSNDYIGALGLGSKAPFSYTTNFTVTAIKDGVKCIYGAFINDSGTPSVTLMHQAQTDEHNGVEVKFNVPLRDDYAVFYRELEVLRWFKDPFKVLNYDATRYGALTPHYEGFPEKDLIPGVHLGGMHTSYAVMGNIAYPLNNIPNPSELGDSASLLSNGLVLEFDLGELDFVASREELSFIPQTYSALRKKLGELSSKLHELALAKINEHTCVWQQARTVMGLPAIYRNAAAKIVPTLGNPLLCVQYGTTYYSDAVIDTGFLETNKLTVSVSSLTMSGRVFTIRPRCDGGVTSYRIDPRNRIVFVLNDTKRGIHTRVLTQVRNTVARNITVVTVTYQGSDVAARSAAFDAFLKTLHNPPDAHYASKYVDQSTYTTRAKAEPKYPVYRGTGSSYEMSFSRSDWEYERTLSHGEHVYVDYLNYEPKAANGSRYRLATAVYHMRRTGIAPLGIVGLSERKKAAALATPGWIHIDAYIARELAKVSDARVRTYAALQSRLAPILDTTLTAASQSPHLQKLLVPYIAANKAAKAEVGHTETMDTRNSYATLLKDDKRYIAELAAANTVADEIRARYPLALKMLSSMSFTSEDVSDYVALVDKATPV